MVAVDKERPFGPRPELAEEFRRTTAGQQFGIVRFKTFLQLIGSKPETVASVNVTFGALTLSARGTVSIVEPLLAKSDQQRMVEILTTIRGIHDWAAQLFNRLASLPPESISFARYDREQISTHLGFISWLRLADPHVLEDRADIVEEALKILVARARLMEVGVNTTKEEGQKILHFLDMVRRNTNITFSG